MTLAYRVANRVPWDADHAPDWGGVKRTEALAITEVMKRLKSHHGGGFKIRERNESFGPKITMKMLEDRIHTRMDSTFKVGNVLMVWALSDDAMVMIRGVDVKSVVHDISEGNDGIDINHALIFGDDGKKKHPTAESWGILNKRYISGTTTWSQHCPWHEDNCTSNAEDFHAGSLAAMRAIADDIAANGKAAKMLLAGSEWLPGDGWRFVGSYINHYDHVHVEPFPTRRDLC